MFVQISKRTAWRLFYTGSPITLAASKIRPEQGCEIKQDLNGPYKDFENLVNSYLYHNCTQETGKGIRFYIKTPA